MAAPGGTLSRRTFVRTVGAGGVLLAAPELWLQADAAGTPDPEQIHLQFGADASREVTVSWATPTSVRRPRLHMSLRKGGSGRTVQADTRTYIDGKSGVEIVTHHAVLTDLEPGMSYVYHVMHEGSGLHGGGRLAARTDGGAGRPGQRVLGGHGRDLAQAVAHGLQPLGSPSAGNVSGVV